MSLNGLGKTQRRISRAFIANPGRTFYTAELVEWAYPRLEGKPERKHRISIRRAAKRVAERVRRDHQGVVFQARKLKQAAISYVGHSGAAEIAREALYPSEVFPFSAEGSGF